ncbi:MAG: sulfite exporter TauE/SafE family protein [Bacteroidetes bacterium]|nr:sulfite exporter TauE/SafE family protein [Bacteroidota bacterium]
MLSILGYLLAVAIGISLGLIGGGGSILTVPVLVYCTGIAAVPATSYSLFVVGVTSAVGAANYAHKHLIHLRAALLFGLPSIVVVYVMRHFVVPMLPETFITIGTWSLTKNIFCTDDFCSANDCCFLFNDPEKAIHEQEHTEYSKKIRLKFSAGIGSVRSQDLWEQVVDF